jgi:sporulation protein YlmC with PRC-barrel domain
MRKTSILLSILILTAMLLAACGGGATSTNVVESPPPVTVDVTETMEATEAPTEAATAEGTATEPGVPVTGGVNPARLSNQLDFTVWSQDGEQIGEVDDMVLDLGNTSVAYVVVSTAGFLDLGDRTVLVPWNSLDLQTGTGAGQATAVPDTGNDNDNANGNDNANANGNDNANANTNGNDNANTNDSSTGIPAGQQNAFILLTDLDTFRNAPDFDLATLPQMGQAAGDWDIDIRNYWQGGAAGGAANTPEAGATAEGTATAEVGAGTATAEPAATADAGADTGQGQALQGVVLATEVLGSTLTIGAGTGTEQATAVPGTNDNGNSNGNANENGNANGNDNANTNGNDNGTGTGTGLDTMTATIEDMIVAIDTGEILYIVINAAFTDGERWIPVPLAWFQWDAATGGFAFNAGGAMLQSAPFFLGDQFPDTTAPDWSGEFDTFWQNQTPGNTNDAGGAEATATP